MLSVLPNSFLEFSTPVQPIFWKFEVYMISSLNFLKAEIGYLFHRKYFFYLCLPTCFIVYLKELLMVKIHSLPLMTSTFPCFLGEFSRHWTCFLVCVLTSLWLAAFFATYDRGETGPTFPRSHEARFEAVVLFMEVGIQSDLCRTRRCFKGIRGKSNRILVVWDFPIHFIPKWALKTDRISFFLRLGWC